MAQEGELITNELVTTRPFGRPAKWTNPEEFARMVEKYFEDCATLRDMPTLSGLAVYLDSDRRTLLNYSKKDDFFPTIKQAKALCEAAIEGRAMLGGINATMAIFSLKNNYGWIDKTENDTKVEMVQPILGAKAKEPIDVYSDDDDQQAIEAPQTD